MKVSVSHIETKDSESKTEIFFPEGVIGFREHKHYRIIQEKSKEPFFWLQAVDDPSLAFIIIDPKQIKPDYRPLLDEVDKVALRINVLDECQVFVFIVVCKDSNKITANFLAPIIINQKENLARQVVLQEQDYSLQHPVLEEVW